MDEVFKPVARHFSMSASSSIQRMSDPVVPGSEASLPPPLAEAARKARRRFLAQALAMGAGSTAAGVAAATAPVVGDGNPAIRRS